MVTWRDVAPDSFVIDLGVALPEELAQRLPDTADRPAPLPNGDAVPPQ
jgi:hypothetical protein